MLSVLSVQVIYQLVGGLHDIKRHVGSVKNTQLLRAVQSQPSIASAMAIYQTESLQDQFTKVEVYFALFVSEHNPSFSTADHFSKLCKKMFSNSKVILSSG